MSNKQLVTALFVLMGIVVQGIALDAWVSEVSCYASNKYSKGGCLFGEDAKAAAMFISWMGLLLFVPLLRKEMFVKPALILWFIGIVIGVCLFVFR